MPDKRVMRFQGNIFKRAAEGFRRLIRETIGELRKVSWPTRREASYLTIIVLVVVFTMGMFLWGLDLAFTKFFALVLGA